MQVRVDLALDRKRLELGATLLHQCLRALFALDLSDLILAVESVSKWLVARRFDLCIDSTASFKKSPDVSLDCTLSGLERCGEIVTARVRLSRSRKAHSLQPAEPLEHDSNVELEIQSETLNRLRRVLGDCRADAHFWMSCMVSEMAN